MFFLLLKVFSRVRSLLRIKLKPPACATTVCHDAGGCIESTDKKSSLVKYPAVRRRTMAWRVSGRNIMIARTVNTSPVTHAYHLDVGLKSGMNFSNSLPEGILPCRITSDT